MAPLERAESCGKKIINTKFTTDYDTRHRHHRRAVSAAKVNYLAASRYQQSTSLLCTLRQQIETLGRHLSQHFRDYRRVLLYHLKITFFSHSRISMIFASSFFYTNSREIERTPPVTPNGNIRAQRIQWKLNTVYRRDALSIIVHVMSFSLKKKIHVDVSNENVV